MERQWRWVPFIKKFSCTELCFVLRMSDMLSCDGEFPLRIAFAQRREREGRQPSAARCWLAVGAAPTGGTVPAGPVSTNIKTPPFYLAHPFLLFHHREELSLSQLPRASSAVANKKKFMRHYMSRQPNRQPEILACTDHHHN
jgi:hypothetical protein